MMNRVKLSPEDARSDLLMDAKQESAAGIAEQGLSYAELLARVEAAVKILRRLPRRTLIEADALRALEGTNER